MIFCEEERREKKKSAGKGARRLVMIYEYTCVDNEEDIAMDNGIGASRSGCHIESVWKVSSSEDFS